MTVLCIGYEDKVSRFFWKIKCELNKTFPKVEFKIYSVFLSGFLFSLFRNISCSWVTISAWIQTNIKSKAYNKILATKTKYKGVEFHNLIDYHLKLDSNSSKKKLLKQALSYIDIFDKQIQKKRPDFVLSWGDSRLAVEAFVAVCKHHRVKIYFMELGPYNTTFFDENGVNANASVLKIYDNQKLLKGNNPKELKLRPKKDTYSRNPVLRALDYSSEILCNFIGVYPPDMMRIAKLAKFGITSKRSHHQPPTEHTKAMFLLALQDPTDVNMVLHSPSFNSPLEILKAVHTKLPKNSFLVVREHPVYRNCNEELFYDYIEKNNIVLDSTTKLETQINRADVILVNNSTTGIEVLKHYKPLVVLGNAYFKYESICLTLSDQSELKTILSKALQYEVNRKEVDLFLEFLFNDYLITGSSDEKPCVAAKSIAKLLSHQH